MHQLLPRKPLYIHPSYIYFFTKLTIILLISHILVVMECRDVKAILVVAAILVFLVGQSSASKCYDRCYSNCRSERNNPSWWCKYDCTLHCIVPPAAKVDSDCSYACPKSCSQLDLGEIKVLLSSILPWVVFLMLLWFTCSLSIYYVSCISNHLWCLMIGLDDMGACLSKCSTGCTKVGKTLWWRSRRYKKNKILAFYKGRAYI